ncbi:RidA family protein [Denitromonas ohlonensis]|uniref:RidA family protein n=2 Tax=Denitromonas TaxID=139331 RepID=A0A557RFN1_9RHOO|nr:RidA family protein [Denitromonas ohlonensis]TVT45133.1 MAG: RidA family protein [Denitromonas halophila]TVO63972.1 RidA family protein [Denitromonas ohlonensis]TVO73048.1 RidA family protein [Denitromonas ohlonensis]TVT70505.1 MAG: RidA family protein [Denitromonas halophila]TVT70856.1 MAG: RidA family protein [Denitromonas halophila]
MTIERHRSNQRASQVVCAGSMVFLAGQVAQDPTADVAGQTAQILAKTEELLALAGSDKSQLLSANIWLPDIRDFQAMNTVWDAWIDGQNPPARACVESRLARPELKVEIQVVALRNPSTATGD